MRISLSLLAMGQEDIRLAIEKESRRNPFLRTPPVPASAGLVSMGGDGYNHQEMIEVQSDVDSLISQISMIRMSDKERAVACELAHCLDERGFFTESPEEIGDYLGTSPELLISIAEKLQISVEPTGVFAWSLKDCFTIQLQAMNRYDPLIASLLDHLDLVASQDINKISDVLNVDREDAEDMLSDIRKLSPAPLKPALALCAVRQIADIIFSPAKNGGIAVALNEAAFPDVLTDDALFSKITTTDTGKSALAYYRDCYRTAGAFVLAMQKRANTLLRLGNEIAGVQSRFVKTGRQIDRKPLTMGGLASELGLNKSTVSRALNNCLIDTPHGLKSATDFFVRPLADGAEDKTRDQALARLSLLIRTEDRKHPHSDEMLAHLLSQTKFKISRRTVAKYRRLLDIPNAFLRRAD